MRRERKAPIELSHCYDEGKKHIDRFASISGVLDSIITYFINRKRVKNGITINSANNAKGYKILKKSLENFTCLKYKKNFPINYSGILQKNSYLIIESIYNSRELRREITEAFMPN